MGADVLNLAEQAARRVKLARQIGAEPQRWIATGEAEVSLIADADPETCSADGSLFHGLPVERGETRWGLELVLAPRNA